MKELPQARDFFNTHKYSGDVSPDGKADDSETVIAAEKFFSEGDKAGEQIENLQSYLSEAKPLLNELSKLAKKNKLDISIQDNYEDVKEYTKILEDSMSRLSDVDDLNLYLKNLDDEYSDVKLVSDLAEYQEELTLLKEYVKNLEQSVDSVDQTIETRKRVQDVIAHVEGFIDSSKNNKLIEIAVAQLNTLKKMNSLPSLSEDMMSDREAIISELLKFSQESISTGLEQVLVEQEFSEFGDFASEIEQSIDDFFDKPFDFEQKEEEVTGDISFEIDKAFDNLLEYSSIDSRNDIAENSAESANTNKTIENALSFSYGEGSLSIGESMTRDFEQGVISGNLGEKLSHVASFANFEMQAASMGEVELNTRLESEMNAEYKEMVSLIAYYPTIEAGSALVEIDFQKYEEIRTELESQNFGLTENQIKVYSNKLDILKNQFAKSKQQFELGQKNEIFPLELSLEREDLRRSNQAELTDIIDQLRAEGLSDAEIGTVLVQHNTFKKRKDEYIEHYNSSPGNNKISPNVINLSLDYDKKWQGGRSIKKTIQYVDPIGQDLYNKLLELESAEQNNVVDNDREQEIMSSFDKFGYSTEDTDAIIENFLLAQHIENRKLQQYSQKDRKSKKALDAVYPISVDILVENAETNKKEEKNILISSEMMNAVSKYKDHYIRIGLDDENKIRKEEFEIPLLQKADYINNRVDNLSKDNALINKGLEIVNLLTKNNNEYSQMILKILSPSLNILMGDTTEDQKNIKGLESARWSLSALSLADIKKQTLNSTEKIIQPIENSTEFIQEEEDLDNIIPFPVSKKQETSIIQNAESLELAEESEKLEASELLQLSEKVTNLFGSEQSLKEAYAGLSGEGQKEFLNDLNSLDSIISYKPDQNDFPLSYTDEGGKVWEYNGILQPIRDQNDDEVVSIDLFNSSPRMFKFLKKRGEFITKKLIVNNKLEDSMKDAIRGFASDVQSRKTSQLEKAA